MFSDRCPEAESRHTWRSATSGDRFDLYKSMNFVLKSINFVLKMIDFALKMMKFVLKIMNFALKTMDLH